MRITNGMLSRNLMNSLNNNLGDLAKYQMQASSGKRLLKLSDDPIGIIASMNARGRLAQIEQYQKRVDAGQEYLVQSETSVMEANAAVQEAYYTAVQLANGFLTGHDKTAAGELVRELRDHVLSLGNSTFGDTYIFGGFNTKKAPFTVDENGNILYNGLNLKDAGNPDLLAIADQNIKYEIGPGNQIDVSFNGIRLLGMGPDNIYSVLDDLHTALQEDAPPDEIASFVGKLKESQNHLLSLAAEIGGKSNRLELVKARYAQDELNYIKMRSNVEDVDEAEAIMNYKMAQTVYTYSLQVGANILRTSLLDFLR